MCCGQVAARSLQLNECGVDDGRNHERQPCGGLGQRFDWKHDRQDQYCCHDNSRGWQRRLSLWVDVCQAGLPLFASVQPRVGGERGLSSRVRFMRGGSAPRGQGTVYHHK